MSELSLPDAKIAHAEIRIGDKPIMLTDALPEMNYRSPNDLGGSPVSVLLYVDDADATFNTPVSAGATSVAEPSDQFDGDRRGTLIDPSGHTWLIATRRATLSPDELVRCFKETMSEDGG